MPLDREIPHHSNRESKDELILPSPELASPFKDLTPETLEETFFRTRTNGLDLVGTVFAPRNGVFLCQGSIVPCNTGRIWIIDADDTLWEDGYHFSELIQEFCETVENGGTTASKNEILDIIDRIGREKLPTHGYGAIGFQAALVESWAYLKTHHRLEGAEPTEFLERVIPYLTAVPYIIRGDVTEFLSTLRARPDERAVLFTQGVLPIQLQKIANSRLAPLFDAVAIATHKCAEAYRELISRLSAKAEEYVVIGNSLSGEVKPAIELGLRVFHLKNPHAWHSGNHTDLDPHLYTSVDSLLEATSALQAAPPPQGVAQE